MELAIINQKIYTVRSVKIMLDRDLAELYEVETRVLNQSVKRNKELFPSDFMFQLTNEEYENMSSQFVMTSKQNAQILHCLLHLPSMELPCYQTS